MKNITKHCFLHIRTYFSTKHKNFPNHTTVLYENTVLLQHSNKTTFKMDEVLAAEGIWAVFYDGKPINLKSSSLVANYPGPKYKKVSFSNPGHAENLAKKLNAQHSTDKFGVYLLKTGDKFTR